MTTNFFSTSGMRVLSFWSRFSRRMTSARAKGQFYFEVASPLGSCLLHYYSYRAGGRGSASPLYSYIQSRRRVGWLSSDDWWSATYVRDARITQPTATDRDRLLLRPPE